jgi:predicted nucleic acid-binding protein
MINKKILIDSNILIAFFRREDIHHKKAIELLSKLDGFYISEHVLFEIGTVLLLKEGATISKQFIDFLNNSENIQIINLFFDEFSQIVNSFPYQKTKLSMVDLSLLIIAKNRDLDLQSFDKELMNTYKNF